MIHINFTVIQSKYYLVCSNRSRQNDNSLTARNRKVLNVFVRVGGNVFKTFVII